MNHHLSFKMKKYIILCVLSLVLICCKEQEQKNIASDELQNPIEYSMVNNANLLLETPEINSVSIGIYKDGKTYTGYYGEMDKGKGNPPDDDSLFEIASVTKTFTGILTAHAVLEGKLTLDDDIRKYLKGSYKNLEYENRPIQIRDLLTHTSGIRRDLSKVLDKMFLLDASKADKEAITNYKVQNLLEDLKQFKLDTIPGKRHDYSPIVGPEILANILENIYQKSYSELLHTYILDTAGMKHTAMTVPDAQKKNIVNSYTDEGQFIAPLPIPMTGAGAGLKSTVPDLMKYVKYLLESSDPVIQEMQKLLFHDQEEDDKYGYFWKLGGTDFMHNGGTNGSTNWLIVLPEYKVGFTVILNSNGEKSGRLINRIANELYDDMENYPKKNVYFVIRKKIIEDTENGIRYYHQLKKENPNDFNFNDESILNRIGYELLRKENISGAIKVFELLVSEFPDSSNPYDSLGEAYLMNGQYDLALKNYKRSLELNPKNGNAKQMIEKIIEMKKNK